MSERFGLSEKTISSVCSVLARHPEVEQAVLFGSRAKGNHKRASDIDLALKGPGLNLTVLNRLYSEMDDLPIPYEFSLVIYDNLDDADILAHIQRVGLPFYERNSVPIRVRP